MCYSKNFMSQYYHDDRHYHCITVLANNNSIISTCVRIRTYNTYVAIDCFIISTYTYVHIGKGQLCAQHGSIFFGDLPAADQGQTQWEYYDY